MRPSGNATRGGSRILLRGKQIFLKVYVFSLVYFKVKSKYIHDLGIKTSHRVQAQVAISLKIMSKLNSEPSIQDLNQMPTNDIIMFILLICFLNQREE